MNLNHIRKSKYEEMKSIKQGDRRDHKFVDHTKYSEQSDQDIVKSILEGEKALFEVLMRRYNQRLFRVQRSYISDEEAIKDTLQRTYIQVFENLDSFRGDAQFSTWITRIAINEALQYLNKEKRYSDLHVIEDLHQTNGYEMKSQETPEDKAIRHDYRELLEEAIDQLPPKYRSVYLMREIEQISTKETADSLNITTENVKVRLHRAKKKVRQALEKEVADTEVFRFRGRRCDLMVCRVMQQIGE